MPLLSAFGGLPRPTARPRVSSTFPCRARPRAPGRSIAPDRRSACLRGSSARSSPAAAAHSRSASILSSLALPHSPSPPPASLPPLPKRASSRLHLSPTFGSLPLRVQPIRPLPSPSAGTLPLRVLPGALLPYVRRPQRRSAPSPSGLRPVPSVSVSGRPPPPPRPARRPPPSRPTSAAAPRRFSGLPGALLDDGPAPSASSLRPAPCPSASDRAPSASASASRLSPPSPAGTLPLRARPPQRRPDDCWASLVSFSMMEPWCRLLQAAAAQI